MPKRHKVALIIELNLRFSSQFLRVKRFGMENNMAINDRQIVVNNKYYAIGQLNKHLSYHFTICIISYFITNVNNFIRNIIYLFILIYINLNTHH